MKNFSKCKLTESMGLMLRKSLSIKLQELNLHFQIILLQKTNIIIPLFPFFSSFKLN